MRSKGLHIAIAPGCLLTDEYMNSYRLTWSFCLIWPFFGNDSSLNSDRNHGAVMKRVQAKTLFTAISKTVLQKTDYYSDVINKLLQMILQ